MHPKKSASPSSATAAAAAARSRPRCSPRCSPTTPMRGLPQELLVGTETADDAAVYRLNDTQALVATTDFFTPIVDDPYDFGRIAATNAISDIYAMGARPIMALALVGMPLEKLPVSVIRKMLEGGESVCAQAGIPIAGGHSIDTLEPIYGLVALGLVHPEKVKRNSSAQTRRRADPRQAARRRHPFGGAEEGQALRRGLRADARLDHAAQHAGRSARRHARGACAHRRHRLRPRRATCSRSAAARGLGAEVRFDALPVIAEALDWVKQGVATGASERNWKGYGHEVDFRGRRLEAQAALGSANQRRVAGGVRARSARRQVSGEFREARLRRSTRHRPPRRRAAAASGYLSSGFSSLQTRSSISGCAASVGWMRSGWKNSGLSAKSSRRNGTSAMRCAFASSTVGGLERRGVDLAVVRRHAHADQQHARAGALRRRWMMAARLVFICATGSPRRPSLPPSSTITTAGWCLSSSGLSRARPPPLVSPEMLALTTL